MKKKVLKKKPAKKIASKKPAAKKTATKKKVAPKKPVAKKKLAAKKLAKSAKTAKKIVLKKTIKPAPAPKPIGSVTHFYNHIKVAVVKFKQDMKVGAQVSFKGATTDFKSVIASMQVDHKPVKLAKKGKQVGIKVQKKVRQGDLIFPVAAK